MNTYAVASVIADVDTAAAHSIAQGIATVSVDHDIAVIHGVSHCILHVAVNGDIRSAEICAHGVSRCAVNGNILILNAGTDIALAQNTLDGNLTILCCLYLTVQLCIIFFSCFNDHPCSS